MVRIKTLTSRLLALPLCFGCVAVAAVPQAACGEVYELIHVVNCSTSPVSFGAQGTYKWLGYLNLGANIQYNLPGCGSTNITVDCNYALNGTEVPGEYYAGAAVNVSSWYGEQPQSGCWQTGSMGGNDFFTFYVWGVSSQASNVPPYFSTVVLSMQNNSSAAQQGYVTYNGYPMLTHAVVNPGATLTYSNHFENDGCSPFVASLLSYGLNGNGVDPLGLPYTDQAVTFSNNLGGVQNGIYTNPEPVLNSPANWLETNGPIDFSSVGGASSTNLGAIMEAAYNELAQSLQSINGNLISNRSGAGSTVISNVVTFQGGSNVWVQNWPSSFTNGGGGASNVWIQNWPSNLLGNVTVTNIGNSTNGASWTNGLTLNQFTNAGTQAQLGQSNRLSWAYYQMTSSTNEGSIPLLGYGSTLLSGNPSSGQIPVASGGAGGLQTIMVGGKSGQIAFTLDSSVMPAFTGVRTGIEWFVAGLVFLICWKGFQSSMQSLLLTPQARTAGEEVLGTNANFAGAIAAAGLILGVVAAAAVFFLPYLAGYAATFMPGNPFSAVSGTFAYSYLDAFVPLNVVASAVGVVLFFRLTCGSVTLVAAGCIKLLVGL